MWGKFSTHSIPLLWDKNVITAMSPLHQNDLFLLHAFSDNIKKHFKEITYH